MQLYVTLFKLCLAIISINVHYGLKSSQSYRKSGHWETFSPVSSKQVNESCSNQGNLCQYWPKYYRAYLPIHQFSINWISVFCILCTYVYHFDFCRQIFNINFSIYWCNGENKKRVKNMFWPNVLNFWPFLLGVLLMGVF